MGQIELSFNQELLSLSFLEIKINILYTFYEICLIFKNHPS